MHLYFYIRGIYSQAELWKTFAQSQFWKWIRINTKTKKEEKMLIQGSLRPSVLGTYEYIFPEECLAEVLSMFGKTKAEDYAIPKARMFVLRKALKVKKIPKKIYQEAKKIPESVLINELWRGLSNIKVPGVAMHVIGIKKDLRAEVMDLKSRIKYKQEML